MQIVKECLEVSEYEERKDWKVLHKTQEDVSFYFLNNLFMITYRITQMR